MTLHAISISTLSPVHIGCDEVYEPSNFVIADGLLHSLNPADLAADLSDAERKQLATLSEGPEPIAGLQQFFQARTERFSAVASHQVALADVVRTEYEQKVGKATQRSIGGAATYNDFHILRTAYRPLDNTPYLPGSSIKGSIRTAWLDKCNGGKQLTADEQRNKRGAARALQERLLGYAAGKFQDDPFSKIGVVDAHPDEDRTAPPTRVLYAISKKKRPPREGERASPDLRVFLETIPDALPTAFLGELRLGGKIDWASLCDACNAFYKPQLDGELSHPVLSQVLDAEWKRLIDGLLGNELGDLIAARQGFLLRVGRHSGAESLTLDGVRSIKILGKKGEPATDRPNTTQKRYASLTKTGTEGLLPFGWVWVAGCDDAHRHILESLRKKLAVRSSALCEAHQDRLHRIEEKRQQRDAAAAQAAERREAAEAAARDAAAAAAAHQAAIAAMSPNLRRVEQFKAVFAARAAQLRGGRERLNADFHTRARDLARDALSGADWTADEKRAAADAIAEWLPKVVESIDKDQLKKLKLSALRTA